MQKEKSSKVWIEVTGWVLASMMLIAAVAALLLALRRQTPAQIPATELELWYMETGDAELDSAKRAALDSVLERFAEEYGQVMLRVTAVPQEDYARELAAAADAPDIFETTGLSPQESVQAASVVNQLGRLSGKAYLACEQASDSQFPTGIVVPMVYVNTTLGEVESVAELAALRDTCMQLGEYFSVKESALELYVALYGEEIVGYGEKTAKNDFLDGRVFVYFGDSTDYFDIQNRLAGAYRVLMPGGNRSVYRYGESWSMQPDNEQERVAAAELLGYFASDFAQDCFHVQTHSGNLPVLEQTAETFAELYGELGAAKEWLGHKFAAPAADVQALLAAADKSVLTELKAGASAVFDDVPADSWYTKAVSKVYAKGLMEGTSATAFEPESAISKADLVTALYRVAGRPEVGAGTPFHDVDKYTEQGKAAVWAYENGIVSGNGEGSFNGGDPVNLETCMLLLYRYAEKAGYDMTIEKKNGQFADGTAVGGWANDSVMWAISHGLFSVQNGGTISPHVAMTRGRFAVILENMLRQMPA